MLMTEERTIGMELRLYRTERGLSLRDASDRIGISENYLSELERDKKMPNDDIIISIANFYELEERYVFERFQKVPLVVQEELIENDELSRTIYNISTDTSLSAEDKEELSKAITNLYERHRKNCKK